MRGAHPHPGSGPEARFPRDDSAAPDQVRFDGDFAGAAVRLAGLAGVMFGWRPDEFWRATPDELAALMRALLPREATPPDAGAIARLMEAYPDG